MCAKKAVNLPYYDMQEDSDYIANARKLSNVGAEGVLNNINRVNVFDDKTRAGLDAYNDDIYNRSYSDFNKQYKNIINNANARDYNRFGTTGATPSLYNRDQTNLQAQQALADLSYNKALNRESLTNNELQRRYNTINAYDNLYGKGEISQALDDRNYQTAQFNKDRAYQNQVNQKNAKNNSWASLIGLGGNVGGAIASALTGIPIFSELGNQLGQQVGGALFPQQGSYISGYNQGGFSNAGIADLINRFYGGGSGSSSQGTSGGLFGNIGGTSYSDSPFGADAFNLNNYLNSIYNQNTGGLNSLYNLGYNSL